MARILALSFVTASLAAAAPEPLITARAELHPRADSSILGWISTSGASRLSDVRSCDFPQTLTQSGSYAQCCEKDKECNFYTTCSAGNVIAESTSVFCDEGFCNTGIILETKGATSAQSYLGCWATSLGKDPITLIQSMGATGPAPTGLTSSTDDSSITESGSAASTGTATVSSSSESESESSPTSESSPSSSSPGAAAGVAKPLTGVVGLIAGLVAML
ncbi:hypothetical protein DPSP01_012538 [Paraphaeosphaeria sporulosa]|uniref:Extracellular membrane protein CFEM domain-containing protein n=1 Tax=Paraphaeosphaeria sporulosa TaxID=1460663 RepID=A0A177BWM8_9PLEO|nr:uncharacterized protein CC84DRAFT_1169480 [Paraphaeosphaeria sporulosa]OAF99360.1 hypothetical protein CC84DRAFT_1169480 [Paraphaeosphaeria sporulosa]